LPTPGRIEGEESRFYVANDVTEADAGFGSDSNRVRILYPSGEIKDLPLLTKEEVSQAILDEVVNVLKQKKKIIDLSGSKRPLTYVDNCCCSPS